MSNTMNIKLEIHDQEALKRACGRLGYKVLPKMNYRLYQTTEYGVGVQIPGMKYPVIVKEDGTVALDDYDWTGIRQRGSRFDNSILAPLEATYGLEKSIGEATACGFLVQESIEGEELVLRVTIPED